MNTTRFPTLAHGQEFAPLCDRPSKRDEEGLRKIRVPDAKPLHDAGAFDALNHAFGLDASLVLVAGSLPESAALGEFGALITKMRYAISSVASI